MHKLLICFLSLYLLPLASQSTERGLPTLSKTYVPKNFASILKQSQSVKRLNPWSSHITYIDPGIESEPIKTKLKKLGKQTGTNFFFSENGGFVGGGGGSGVQRGENFDSLDLVQLDPSFRDVESLLGKSKYIIKSNKKSSLNKTELFLFNHLNQLEKKVLVSISEPKSDFLTSGPFLYAREVLESFNAPMNFMPLLMDRIIWRWTNEEPYSQRRFDPSGLKNVSGIETVAYFKFTPNQSPTVVISTPRWNRLGFFSQVAIILHETLRFYQFSNAVAEQRTIFLEKDLQRAVSLITFCRPTQEINHFVRLFLSRFSGHFDGPEGLGYGVTYKNITNSCHKKNEISKPLNSDFWLFINNLQTANESLILKSQLSQLRKKYSHLGFSDSDCLAYANAIIGCYEKQGSIEKEYDSEGLNIDCGDTIIDSPKNSDIKTILRHTSYIETPAGDAQGLHCSVYFKNKQEEQIEFDFEVLSTGEGDHIEIEKRK